jgi:ribosomal protein S18 acetylase RimI-like enzyme
MKAKALKQLRKTLARANKLENNPLDIISKDLLQIDLPTNATATENSDATTQPVPPHLSIQYFPSVDLVDTRFKQCIDLWENNMGDLYRGSSWGFDLKEKSDEFRHANARFLLLTAADNDSELAGFVHFRFVYDDEDKPSCAALYVYEIQVASTYQRQGIGKHFMKLMEKMGGNAEMTKVLLTVFKANNSAMKFYTETIQYSIDESSPSKWGEQADYEILCKSVLLESKN